LKVGTYFFEHQKNDETNQLERLYIASLNAVNTYRTNPYVILADCTYKTNNADMPLFNICGTNGNKNILQIAVVYLSQEREEDYDWACQVHRRMMTEHEISDRQRYWPYESL
jgi:MULE transposase domain